MAATPDMHLRRLAERSRALEITGHPVIGSLADAMPLFSYRTAIALPLPGQTTMRAQDLPPILGAVALVPGVPFEGADLAQAVNEARIALEQGGTFLILAADKGQRDDAKARIQTALGILISPTVAGGRA